jgi:hypothetical protein
MMDSSERWHLVCSCSHADHQVVFSHWPGDFDAVYLTVHLVPTRSWWRRLRAAVRHVFGGSPCGFGDWAEVIINDPADARRLSDLMLRFAASAEAGR